MNIKIDQMKLFKWKKNSSNELKNSSNKKNSSNEHKIVQMK